MLHFLPTSFFLADEHAAAPNGSSAPITCTPVYHTIGVVHFLDATAMWLAAVKPLQPIEGKQTYESRSINRASS